MARTLDRKLIRDLARLKGQVATIALVVACGVASFVALRGTYTSIDRSRTAFYERQRFADVFVHVERAPASVREALSKIDGVATVDVRVVEVATILLADDPLPIPARVVSMSERLNAVRLHSGRPPARGHAGEVVALRQFAEARDLHPGDRLVAVVNGRQRDLRIVGTADSPEFVFAVAAGAMAPDPDRFAVLWMDADAVAQAFAMEGAFNDVILTLQPGAPPAATIAAADRLLAPYGTDGAYGRDQQPSHRSLEGELGQLYSLANVLPLVFLAVAALLVHVVLSRLVYLQQQEIAMLKAVGYSDGQVGAHFLALVLIVGGLGALAGVVLGRVFGGLMVGLYTHYFKLPGLRFELDVGAAAAAALISFAAAAAGAFGAVRRAVRMPPAEAMRPQPPTRYSRSIVDRLGLARALGPVAHMVVRELERHPVRTLMSVLAVAASTGLAVVGGWYYDGVEALIDTQFVAAMREDLAVAFVKPRSDRSVRELGHLPGVDSVEALRAVPVRFRAGHRSRDGVVWGHPPAMEMRQVRDQSGRRIPLPPAGVVLSDVLARILHVDVGGTVDIEVREGERATRSVIVTGLVSDAYGLNGHMTADALRATLGEQPLASMALLRIDPAAEDGVNRRLKDTPAVADVVRKARLLQRFRDQTAGTILTMAMIVWAFAATITVGVVYNNARIALALRSRDLASLRVLGFSRREISAVLLGEMAVQVVLAVPIGLMMGLGLVHALAATVDPETWRMPVMLTAKSYASAAVVTLAAGLATALVVRRRLDRLDLVAVLKARD
jgi:putative ABC transport system permease protein